MPSLGGKAPVVLQKKLWEKHIMLAKYSQTMSNVHANGAWPMCACQKRDCLMAFRLLVKQNAHEFWSCAQNHATVSTDPHDHQPRKFLQRSRLEEVLGVLGGGLQEEANLPVMSERRLNVPHPRLFLDGDTSKYAIKIPSQSVWFPRNQDTATEWHIPNSAAWKG